MKIAAVKWKFNGDETMFNKFLENVVRDYLDLDPFDTTVEIKKKKKEDEKCA